VQVFGSKYFPRFDVTGKFQDLETDRRDIEKTDLSDFAEAKKQQLKNNYISRNKRRILKLSKRIGDRNKRKEALELEGRVRLPVYLLTSLLRHNKQKGYTLFFELENIGDFKNGDITVVPGRIVGPFESIEFRGKKSENFISNIVSTLNSNIRLLKFFQTKLDSFSADEIEVEYLTMRDKQVYKKFIKNLIEVFEIGRDAIENKNNESTVRRAYKVAQLSAVIYLIP